MPDPATLDEYVARFHANTKVHGYGLDLTNEVPCPFCGAPNFAAWQVVAGILPGDERPNLDAQMGEETTCSECGRSGRHIVVRDPSGVSATFVQTGGPDPPAYLPPLRRE